jgi:spermidine/putrescine transport system permease protein
MAIAIQRLISRKSSPLLFFLLPATCWLVLFFAIPVVIVLFYSFLQPSTYANISWSMTVQNYQQIFNTLYLDIFGRSLWLALLTTLVCALIGYPLAYFIVRQSPPWRSVLLLLVVIPFWTNFLVRTYAWMILLRQQGVVNSILSSLHLIDQPLTLLFTPFSVGIGLIYGYLPFMILPIYSTLERFDFSLVQAAQDLGASGLKAFLRIVLPLTLRGIVAGSLLVFIPAIGAFVTPDILGGAKTMMVGNLIQNQFLKALNWPLGSALSMALMGVILVPVLLYFYISDNETRKGSMEVKG